MCEHQGITIHPITVLQVLTNHASAFGSSDTPAFVGKLSLNQCFPTVRRVRLRHVAAAPVCYKLGSPRSSSKEPEYSCLLQCIAYTIFPLAISPVHARADVFYTDRVWRTQLALARMRSLYSLGESHVSILAKGLMVFTRLSMPISTAVMKLGRIDSYLVASTGTTAMDRQCHPNTEPQNRVQYKCIIVHVQCTGVPVVFTKSSM